MAEIGKILDAYHVQTLSMMVEAADMSVAKQGQVRKASLLKMMRNRFFTGERISASLAQLNQRERTILDELVRLDGPISSRRFKRRMVNEGLAQGGEAASSRSRRGGHKRTASYQGDPHHLGSSVFEDIVARLTLHGLVFSRGNASSTGGSAYKLRFSPGQMLFVPDEVKRHLPIPAEVAPRVLEPDQVLPGSATVLLRDLYLYWDTVRRGRVHLIQSGLVGKRDLKTINSMLIDQQESLSSVRREDEAGRLYFLRQMLEALGLVRAKGKQLVSTAGDGLEIPDFWMWSTSEQIAACLEVSAVLDGVVELGPEVAQYAPSYQHARDVVLDVLGSLPVGKWRELAGFIDLIVTQDPDFLFPARTQVEQHHGNYYYGYRSGYFSGRPDVLLETFDRYENSFVLSCLTGFLHQLGIVDLGYKGEQLLAFRRCDASKVGESDGGKVIVQPNFQIMAMGAVPLDLLAKLDILAARLRVDRAVFEYELSRDSVYHAQQQGMEAREVLAILQEHTVVDLPQNVRRSLDEWAANHERIVFRDGVGVIQTGEPDLLRHLMDDPLTGRFISRSLSARVAILNDRDARQIEEVLVEQGRFPSVLFGEAGSADGSVMIKADGWVEPIQRTPNLFLHGRLGRLAEQLPDGRWRLSPESIAALGGSRNRVRRVLDELEKLHCGDLPSEIIEQVKVWGHYYGDAKFESLALIEFNDRATLDELLSDRRLQHMLHPFSVGAGQVRALAAVQEEALDDVLAILADMGIQVHEGIDS